MCVLCVCFCILPDRAPTSGLPFENQMSAERKESVDLLGLALESLIHIINTGVKVKSKGLH